MDQDLRRPEQGAAPLRNPWVDCLPRRTRRSKKGLIVFLLLVALLLLATLLYGIFVGPPDYYYEYTPNGDGSSLLSADVETTLPSAEGGDARLTLVSSHGETLSASEVFEAVNPAVVSVITDSGDGTGSLGTGVLFTADGYFLTNAHVIEGAASCTILLSDGRSYEAALVGADEARDVAVLKALDAEGLPTAELGDSRTLSVGDTVYAIGSPLDLEFRSTLTDGIVSSISRNVQVDGRSMTLIQTNAALNQGNSGGPLINEYGQVVGLNAVKISAAAGETSIEGLGFAIPTETVEYLANQILQYGYALGETSLGIQVYAAGTEESDVQGLYVASVDAGSCAETAGVRVGDIITAADGQSVSAVDDLLALRRAHAPGEEMTLTLRRGAETLTVTVVLDEA